MCDYCFVCGVQRTCGSSRHFAMCCTLQKFARCSSSVFTFFSFKWHCKLLIITLLIKLHYNIYRLVFTIWTVKIIKMKIPLGSCTLYAKRNMPWESAKWDLQNKKCAKYTLEKRAHPSPYYVCLRVVWRTAPIILAWLKTAFSCLIKHLVLNHDGFQKFLTSLLSMYHMRKFKTHSFKLPYYSQTSIIRGFWG